MSEYFWRKHNQERALHMDWLNYRWFFFVSFAVLEHSDVLKIIHEWKTFMTAVNLPRSALPIKFTLKGNTQRNCKPPKSSASVTMLNVLGFWNNVLLDRWEQSGDGNAQPHICCAISVQTGKHSGGRVMIWAPCSLWVNRELLCVPKSSEGKC